MSILDDTAVALTNSPPPAEEIELRRLSPDGVLGHGGDTGDMHHFPTLQAAITFAMEHLSEDARKLAWIRAGDRTISHQEIERLYREDVSASGQPGVTASGT
jgi:hypothetical protein